MAYQNSLYGLFNQPFIENQLRTQHHNDQIMKSLDCAKKLGDFMESMNQVEPKYQLMAMEQCCAVIMKYLKKNNNFYAM